MGVPHPLEHVRAVISSARDTCFTGTNGGPAHVRRGDAGRERASRPKTDQSAAVTQPIGWPEGIQGVIMTEDEKGTRPLSKRLSRPKPWRSLNSSGRTCPS